MSLSEFRSDAALDSTDNVFGAALGARHNGIILKFKNLNNLIIIYLVLGKPACESESVCLENKQEGP